MNTEPPRSSAQPPPSPAPVKRQWSFALRAAAGYAIAVPACTWLADRLLDSALSGQEITALGGLARGLAFVLVSAPVLYLLLRRESARTAMSEAALHETELRLKRMAALSADWFWEADAQLRVTNITGIGRHGADLTGAGLIGKGYAQMEGFRLISISPLEFDAVRAARKPYRDIRAQATDNSGRTAYLSISGEPRFDEAGAFTGYRGVMRDVTREMSALERLRLSEANFRAIAEHPGIAKALVLPGGKPVYVNQAYARLLGYSVEELLAGESRDFTLPEDLPATLALVGQCVKGERDHYRQQKRFLHKDGHVIWAEVDASAVRDDKGTLLHLVIQTQDITARRAAEEALREAQQRLRMTVELAGMGISEVALDGRFLRVNPALCRITGYTEAELTRLSGLDITPPDEVDQSRDRMAQAVAGGGDRYTLEKRYLQKDGHVVWVELTAALARDAEGKPAYFVSVTQDISRRKEAEGALRASETRYRSVVDALAEGVLLSTADGTVLTYNPAARAIFGADFDELLHRGPRSTTLRLFDESGLQIPVGERPSAVALLSGRPVHHRVARIVRTDTSEAWLRITAVPLQRPGTEVSDVLLVLSDVTAERAGAAALAGSESRYRSVVETMTEAILLMDSQGRVIGSNRAAVRVFGIGLAEVANAGPFSPKLRLFREDGSEVPTEERPSYQVLKSGTPVVDAIYPAIRPDGTHLWVHINATSLSFAPGALPGAVVTLADITARIEAERALKTLTETLERRVTERTAELSQLNRELESFAYSVSHDLRAPLRAISGFASLLSEDERERLSAEGVNLLERISTNAERMGELIDDVLEYSRVTRIDRKLEMVDMGEVAAEVAARLAAPYPDTRVSIGPLGHARADLAMVRQILENLIGNAFKYSAKVAAPAIRVDTEHIDGVIWYRIADNGVGFDMRYADRLFGMFQRMHPAADFAGTGVGLAIVKRLVERHGGQIEGDASPGAGATFRFHLGRPESANGA